MKKTGQEWCELTGVRIISPTGWTNEKAFHSEKIDRWTFLNLASNSVVEKPQQISRRDAAKLKQSLGNKSDY